jgi:hypothetical protein
MTRLVTHGKSEQDRLREGEEILSDRVNGMPVSQMMEKYGVSRQTIYNRIEQATMARVVPTVDKYREMMNAAYDEQVTRANQNIEGCLRLIEMVSIGTDPAAVERALAAHVRAVELLNRTREAQRKLNGLDLPQRVDVTVTVQDETDKAIADLNARLAGEPAAR